MDSYIITTGVAIIIAIFSAIAFLHSQNGQKIDSLIQEDKQMIKILYDGQADYREEIFNLNQTIQDQQKAINTLSSALEEANKQDEGR